MKAQFSDSAGAFGAIVAALCCAGTPFLVAGLAGLGLSFLRKDAILWPVMLGSLAIAIWGLWLGWRMHRRKTPLFLGTAGALSLALGVIVVHGSPAMEMIYGGATVLLLAVVLNIRARAACR